MTKAAIPRVRDSCTCESSQMEGVGRMEQLKGFHGLTRDWFGQRGRHPPPPQQLFNFKKGKQKYAIYVKKRGTFSYKGGWANLSWLARRSWICSGLPSPCSASLHPSSHLHVAVLIDRATVIPSEFLTRWHGGAGTSQELILDRREVYVSSFHRLYWWSCVLIMTHSSQISTVQALEAFLKRRLLNGARSHRRGFSWFRFSLF